MQQQEQHQLQLQVHHIHRSSRSNFNYVPGPGRGFVSCGWSHENVAHHHRRPFPRCRRHTVWTLGLVLERHHFLARFRHQTLRHHVRVVCGYRLHLRYQVGENGAFGRRQRQVAHPAQIELAHATRNVVVHVVLYDARRPAHGRVPLEGARVVVVGVQVVLARPSGQRVEAAVQRIHVVHRRGPEEVDLLSLSGDLGRRHRDRDEGQVVRGLGPVVAVHHHELRRLVWVVLQLLVLLVLLQVMLAGG